MRKTLFILLLLLLNSCGLPNKGNHGYKELEDGIVKIYDNKDGMSEFTSAAKKGNLEVYDIVSYLGTCASCCKFSRYFNCVTFVAINS